MMQAVHRSIAQDSNGVQQSAPELLPPSAADGATVRPINEALKPARMKVVAGKAS
jgi:hypothetical protein